MCIGRKYSSVKVYLVPFLILNGKVLARWLRIYGSHSGPMARIVVNPCLTQNIFLNETITCLAKTARMRPMPRLFLVNT